MKRERIKQSNKGEVISELELISANLACFPEHHSLCSSSIIIRVHPNEGHTHTRCDGNCVVD